MVQDAGVDTAKPIVIVPSGTSVADVNDGMRLYWQFKLYGEDNIAMLDGGMAAWLQDGKPFVKDALVAELATGSHPPTARRICLRIPTKWLPLQKRNRPS